ncbi:MAG: TonB family protein [Candidatus Sulfotelmatobacter sp.]
MRCLLFSSDAEIVQPIWQVLADLGIEGEYCQSGVDAVEKVTTQSFQIVVTDWENQPEAAFLLKTVRELKAAQRPLTLAIVSDDARRPHALQAGANSILLKPIRAEQVRDTMSTACELLRSKLQLATSAPARETPPTLAHMAAAAAVSAGSVPGSAVQPTRIVRPDTPSRKELEVRTPEEPAVAKPVPKTDMVAEVEPTDALDSSAAVQLKPQEALTGWAMLQARLTKSSPRAAASAPAKSDLLSYGETRSYSGPSAPSLAQDKAPAREDSHADAATEATLFAYISGKSSQDSEPAATARPKRGKVFMVATLAVVCVGLGAVPRTRQSLLTVYRNSIRAASRVLNPPPAPLPEAVALHDSFGQSGDEYKLPVPVNIPDATTDPSQIRVLPTIDPTAKPQKTPDANGEPEQKPSDNPSVDQDQTAPIQGAQGHGEDHELKDASPANAGDLPKDSAEARTDAPPTRTEPTPSAPVVQPATPRLPVTSSPSVPQHATSATVRAGIPSSLKSQIASSTPLSSGSKPVEAAMSSIEPVNLPEPVEREFLVQPVDAVYPAAARANGQRGIVVLQVLIGRDGSVQDAKFLQGSLVFARAAIDAVKLYRFKPYTLNGRAVSVQSVITLTFKPPV